MYIIAGLGNPGKEYERTRHNTGFIAIDKLAKKHGIIMNQEKHKAVIGKGLINGEKVILIKPQTFMNLSGESIFEVMNFYKESLENFIVIFDDIDLPLGTIRIKDKGSAGTHNGVKSLVKELGSEHFKRIKVGVGKPERKEDLVNYVLGRFSDIEFKEIESSTDNAVNAVEIIIKENVFKAMNEFN